MIEPGEYDNMAKCRDPPFEAIHSARITCVFCFCDITSWIPKALIQFKRFYVDGVRSLCKQAPRNLFQGDASDIVCMMVMVMIWWREEHGAETPGGSIGRNRFSSIEQNLFILISRCVGGKPKSNNDDCYVHIRECSCIAINFPRSLV